MSRAWKRLSAAGDPTLHAPYACRRCGAPILWGQLLDHAGERMPRSDGRGWRVMAVDAEPTPTGNVALFDRPGLGIVARVLKPGEAPPPGARLRRRHPYPCSGGGA